MVPPEFLNFVKEHSENYFEAVTLMHHDSKNDPITAPYQSYYQSRELLSRILDKLKEVDTNGLNVFTRLMSVLHFKLGLNYTETEESPAGEEHFKHCKTLMDSCEEDPERSLGIIHTMFNQLGFIYSQRGDFENGLESLMQAKIVYQKLKMLNCKCPWSADDFFKIEAYTSEPAEETKRERMDLFEDNFTHTLYYLAQVYGKLERRFDSAEYCKETLKRQLIRHKYEPLDWSMNAATLSQFYTSNNEFGVARHCLASAELILKEYGNKPADLSVKVRNKDTQDEVDAKEKLPKAWADLFRCWIKYAISLLEYSRDQLLEKLENEGKEHGASQNEETRQIEEEPFNLELTSIENQITAKPVLVFNEAREVFLCGQKWISSAKEFYVLDGHCSDHVELIRDHSCLFKLLTFFEVDLNRQCKMLKRRSNMLSEVLQELNPQCYSSICQQLSFEIGEVYSAMLDNKLAILELSQDEDRCRQMACKINSLAKNSLEYFQLFLKYLKDHEERLPDKFPEELERPVLIAHFYCGRLHSKLITPDRQEQLSNISRSLDCYKYLVNYCKSNPSAIEKVKEERSACEEMVQLLPAKMDKIRSLING